MLTKVNLRSAVVLALLGLVVAESTALASQRIRVTLTPSRTIVTTSSQAMSVRWIPLRNREAVVLRRGAPAIVFTDDSAIGFQLALTRAEIQSFEHALAKDLAHREFRARQTRRAVSTSEHTVARSTADELVSTQRELGRLKTALRNDLANGDLRAPQTRRELARREHAPLGNGADALASGAISVSDDIWGLEMAVEKDLHARDFTAIETHFEIDGRRWKVR